MFITATIQSIVSGMPTAAGRSTGPRNGNVKWSIQTPKKGGIDAATNWPASLRPGAQHAEVVDRADDGRDRGAEQDAARLAAELEERERRHEDAEEDRDPAEPRHRVRVQPPRLRPVDDAEQPRHPADRGRQQDHDHERGDRAVENLADGRAARPSVLRHFVP